jgi:hypothetical protein
MVCMWYCGLCPTGHGVCDQVTRQCLCEAFWMQNLIVKHLGSGDSNCGECFTHSMPLGYFDDMGSMRIMMEITV